MLSKLYLSIAGLFIHLSITASELSLITCEPGDALYSAYGHSALRYKTQGLDIVFNFGTFNFSQQDFYLNFANGILDYEMSISYFSRFKERYQQLGRNLTELKLNIDSATTDQIALDLMQQQKAGEHLYRYDFVKANCATKIWDVFKKHLPHLHIDSTAMQPSSYRDLLNSYTYTSFPWLRFSTDLILGSRLDQLLATEQTGFLPDYLEQLALHSFNGYQPLVQDTQHYTFVDESRPPSPLPQPSFVITILFTLSLIRLIRLSPKNTRHYLIDQLIYFSVGVLGIIVWFMNFISLHYTAAENVHIVWANPFILFFIFPFFRRQKHLTLWFGLSYLCFPIIALLCSQTVPIELLLISQMVAWHLLDSSFRMRYLNPL